jgi:hypothetical protein
VRVRGARALDRSKVPTPIGAGCGGLWIEGGESLIDALERATAELFDPDLCFDDPAEEDMARAMVPLLLTAARAGKGVLS